MQTPNTQVSPDRLDPFCVENNLGSWASSLVISRGREYYRGGRVLSLDFDGDTRIQAQVAGGETEPYQVTIQFDPSGMPVAECTCPFDWEPLCKHAVAALLAWQQQETGSEPTLGPLSAPLAVPPDDPAAKENYLQDLAHAEDRSAFWFSLRIGSRAAV